MKQTKIFLSAIALLLVGVVAFAFIQDDAIFLAYRVNPKELDVKLYWQDEHTQNFGSIQNLKQALAKNKKQLLFAMNGGMYKPGGPPQGLYI